MVDNIQTDLGKALAPDDEIYNIVEDDEVVDPLDEDAGLVVEDDPFSFTVKEEGIPTNELLDLPERSIEMGTDLMGDIGDEVEIIDAITDIEEDDDLPDEEEIFEEAIFGEPDDSIPDGEIEIIDDEEMLDYEEPGALVSSVLNTARKFVTYSEDSRNSMRRAEALCDTLENMIISGVMQDAKHCKLNLAQLRLLDDIEAGIHETRAHLNRFSNKKQVYAKAVGDQGLMGGMYDPFCATIARVLINAQVQGGKKVQDVFEKLKEKYNIDKREEFQISQIMLDLGYPVLSILDGEDMIEQRYA